MHLRRYPPNSFGGSVTARDRTLMLPKGYMMRKFFLNTENRRIYSASRFYQGEFDCKNEEHPQGVMQWIKSFQRLIGEVYDFQLCGKILFE